MKVFARILTICALAAAGASVTPSPASAQVSAPSYYVGGLGASFSTAPTLYGGVLVSAVSPTSPLLRVALPASYAPYTVYITQPYDVIMSLNGMATRSVHDLEVALMAESPRWVPITIMDHNTGSQYSGWVRLG